MDAPFNSNSASAEATLPLAPTIGALGVPLRAALDGMRRGGFRAVQLSAAATGSRPRDLDQSARRDLLAALRRRELQLSGLDIWVPVSHFGDPTHVDRAIEAVCDAIGLAEDLQRVPVSLNLPEPDGESAAAYESIINAASHRGVELINHTLDARAEPEGIVTRGIDPAAWLAADRDPISAISTIPGQVGGARLVDLLRTGMRGAVGEPVDGRLDVSGYQVALSVCGYDRPVIVDCRQWADPGGGLVQTARTWTNS